MNEVSTIYQKIQGTFQIKSILIPPHRIRYAIVSQQPKMIFQADLKSNIIFHLFGVVVNYLQLEIAPYWHLVSRKLFVEDSIMSFNFNLQIVL